MKMLLKSIIQPEYCIAFAGGALLGNARTAVVTIAKSDFPNGKFSFLGETERSIPNPDTPQTLVFYVERTEGLLGQQEVCYSALCGSVIG